VDSVQDVRSHLMPLKDSDVDTVLWNTSREDSCYYPTKVGNKITDIGARIGIYPYWTATDIQKMLDHGDDPLTAVCDVGHECGLKVYASYRRMTFRMPPFVFPLHPNAFLIKHPECRCVDRDGEAVPHLSMAYPEVRQLMIDIFVEQAENYDIDGVHMYFCRGVPFIYFEGSFVDAFVKEYNCDPRALPVDDERVWKVRAKFFLTYMRDLRAALDRVGEARGKRVDIALNVMNSPRVCMYFGMDIKALAEEKLVDLLMPAQAHFFPREELGEWHLLPEFVAEFVKIAKPHGIQVRPECGTQYWDDNRTIAQLAKEYYDVGADGIQAGVRRETCSGYEGGRRLGHVDQLDQFNSWVAGARRMVKVKKVAGLTFDTISGVVTCG